MDVLGIEFEIRHINGGALAVRGASPDSWARLVPAARKAKAAPVVKLPIFMLAATGVMAMLIKADGDSMRVKVRSRNCAVIAPLDSAG
ncbi:MAG: hypothetical protein WAN51_10225 [Alphaproteobacteria bacterium]